MDGHADYVIASEEVIPVLGLDYDAFSVLAQPTIDPTAIFDALATAYETEVADAQPSDAEGFTLSMFDVNQTAVSTSVVAPVPPGRRPARLHRAACSRLPVNFPDDTIGITDDTGLLRIGVPPSWTDRLTTPRTATDATTMPFVAASTDLDAFLHDPAAGTDPFTAPGVIYTGVPYTADTAGLFAQLTDGQACAPGVVQQYAGAVFNAHIQGSRPVAAPRRVCS